MQIKGGEVPTTEGAACYDVRSGQTVTLDPETATIVNTSLKLEIPTGYGLLLTGRSKEASQGFTVEGGIIDSGYPSEIKVIIFNHTQREKRVQAGKRIAQAWFLLTPSLAWITVDTWTAMDQDEDGHGGNDSV